MASEVNGAAVVRSKRWARRWRVVGVAALVAGMLSCGGSAPTDSGKPGEPATPATVTVSTSSSTMTVGNTLQLDAVVRDAQGRVVSATLDWSSSSPEVATVSPAGLVTALTPGTTSVRASVGTVVGVVSLTVTGPVTFVAGQSYFGRNGYIEYIAGNAPVILTAPHGGSLTPASIPDRTGARCGGEATTVTDVNTQELVRTMQERFFARFGTYPHVVISLLSRRKLDPNRLQTEAACGNAEALAALDDWHTFIDAAKSHVLQTTGKGWYMDMHGHGHAIQQLEVGYLLSASDLERSDAALDGAATFEQQTSLRTLSQHSPLSFSALLRGPTSLGSLYATNGFPAVPSTATPSPAGAPYFNGGDNTVRHTCGGGASSLGGTTGGNICGVQIEANFTNVRDTPANRQRFADATATVLEQYLRTHWDIRLQP